jgi:hypothetical protein
LNCRDERRLPRRNERRSGRGKQGGLDRWNTSGPDLVIHTQMIIKVEGGADRRSSGSEGLRFLGAGEERVRARQTHRKDREKMMMKKKERKKQGTNERTRNSIFLHDMNITIQTEGEREGMRVGSRDGAAEGNWVGWMVGMREGEKEGSKLGAVQTQMKRQLR